MASLASGVEGFGAELFTDSVPTKNGSNSPSLQVWRAQLLKLK